MDINLDMGDMEFEDTTETDSDSDDDIILSLGLVALLNAHQKTTPKRLRKKRFWVNGYLQDRKDKGRFYKDFADMKKHPKTFYENFHMSSERFDELLHLLEPSLKPRRNTRSNDSICPAEKLSMTMEFLASGSLQRHVASVYRVSKQRFGRILEEVCEVIIDKLQLIVLKDPDATRWIEVSNDFNSKWNFPNCIGSVDGKHVGIKCPKNAETSFFNYKGFHSIILMAAADADCKFIYFDVGAYGSEADGQVFRSSDLGKKLATGTLGIPVESNVYGKKVPYYFVADDAFPLQRHILKPYKPTQRSVRLSDDERIFNYRLSRARRTVENCFGILCARWICLARTLFVNPVKAQKIIAACCLLHNFCMNNDKQYYCPKGFSDTIDIEGNLVEGSWRKILPEDSMMHNELPTQIGGRTSLSAKELRNHIKTYVNSTSGSLPWQRNSVHL